MKWKMEKATLGFQIYKICQILKRFTGTFRRAQILTLGRVRSYLGKMTFSSDDNEAWSLNAWNALSLGGYRNGVAPKLNWHCWNDIKLAAAKNPEDTWWNTWLNDFRGFPLW